MNGHTIRAKNSAMEKNINDPGNQEIESPYYKRKDEEEKEEIPVEYLAYLQQRKAKRIAGTIYFILLAIIIVGISPSQKGAQIDPRNGQVRTWATLAWGYWVLTGEPENTAWTAWYQSHNPEYYDSRWLPFEKTYPGLFIYLTTPFGIDYNWIIPESLVDRMSELEPFFRPGKILDIPRTLYYVNNGQEWNAIVLPLSVGTPEEAYRWWDEHHDLLQKWANQPVGTPLYQIYIDEAQKYYNDKTEDDGWEIPLI